MNENMIANSLALVNLLQGIFSESICIQSIEPGTVKYALHTQMRD